MATAQGPPLIEILAEIPDARQEQGRRHSLAGMLALACVATLCGYENVKAIAEWEPNYGEEYAAAFGFERHGYRMRSGGKTGIVVRGESGKEGRSGLTGTVSHEGSAQAVEDRTRRWATGFDPSQDTFDQPAAMIGLSAMRSAPPDHRVTPGALGTVVGGVEPWD